MIETVETVKDVEKQLSEARTKLQAFEDGVDRARLLKRLKTASPAHPVLLFRALFLFLTGLMAAAAVVVLVIPFVNADLARRIARFDAVVPVPPDVPGLPALLGLLAFCMLIGWVMTTLAALAMGRDAQMLPWEQKQHQKLVNEVTRLTTQKAVMERMRSTPAGARPRIETPVPVSLRDRAGMATPSALGRLGESGTPPGISGVQPGRFGGPASSSGNPFGRAPGAGSSSGPPSRPGGGGLFGRAPTATPPPAPSTGAGSPAGGPGGGGGVLARARSGALKTTPAGAAGRLTPNFNRSGPSGFAPEEEGSDDSGPFGASGSPAAGGSPFGGPSNPSSSPTGSGDRFGGGSNPFAQNNPFGSGGASVSAGPPSGGGAFGTPPPLGRATPGAGLAPEPEADGLPAIVESSQGYKAAHSLSPEEMPDDTAAYLNRKPVLPRWGAISDPWLEDAIQAAEELANTLPLQAHLSFSEETHLPFTLVIARATPPTAAKALGAFVNFLSAIPTPPRARIELNASPGLDRSFHRNVEAALSPIYGEDFEVDLEPGRVEVAFSQPDEAWQDYPILPIK